MKVKGFKLVTGEEIIARVVETSDTIHKIIKPMALVQQQYETNRVGMGLIPWIIGTYMSDSIVDLYINNVICSYDPISEIEKEYILSTTSIQLS